MSDEQLAEYVERVQKVAAKRERDAITTLLAEHRDDYYRRSEVAYAHLSDELQASGDALEYAIDLIAGREGSDE